MNCEPANTIIKSLGLDAIAEACGVHKSRVYRWRSEKIVGGTGGTIPQTHHRDILELARRKGVFMMADHFLPAAKPERAGRAPNHAGI